MLTRGEGGVQGNREYKEVKGEGGWATKLFIKTPPFPTKTIIYPEINFPSELKATIFYRRKKKFK